MLEDPKAYLERNAASMRAYRLARPDVIKAIKDRINRNPEQLLQRIRRDANKRGKAFTEEDADYFVFLLLQPCFYCGHHPAAINQVSICRQSASVTIDLPYRSYVLAHRIKQWLP